MEFRQPTNLDDYTLLDTRPTSTRRLPMNGGKLVSVANWIVENNNIVSIKKGKSMYAWNGSCYETNVEEELNNLVEIMYLNVGWNYRPTDGDNVRKLVYSKTAIDADKINASRDYIPFLNGWYNIKTNMMEKPNPAIYITYTLPWNYNPTAKCPLFKKTMRQIVPNTRDRYILFKFMAYCMTSRVNLQKAMILYGRGSNGKTVIMDVMKKIVGDKLHSMIPLQEMGSRFNKVVYMGKLANLTDDIPHNGLQDDSFIKEMITASTLNGEIKNKMPFNYTNTCKIMATCNQIPKPSPRVSDGFYRRWIIIPLTQKFTGRDDDFDLGDKLVNEIEGIIAYLIKHIKTMYKLKYITLEESREKWLLYGESAVSFFYQCIDTDTPYSLKKGWMYDLYKRWCNSKDLNLLSQVAFGKEMAKLGLKSTKNSRGEWVYSNCKLLLDDDELDSMGLEETSTGNYRLKSRSDV